MDHRVQYIVTNAELVSGGWTSGNNFIRSLAFNAASSSGQVMNSFTVKIAYTTATAFSSTSYLTLTSPVTVYSANYTPVAGWNTHTFTTPFSYNGTSNLLIDICWNNSTFTSDCSMYATTLTSYRALYLRQDAASGGVCSNTTGTRSYARANMRIGFSSTSAREASADQEINLGINPMDVSLYPNPNNGQVTLEYNLDKDASQVYFEVYNLMGALVAGRQEENKAAGHYTTSMNLEETAGAALSSGVYLLQMRANDSVITRRFIVNK
jgi:hypothetical protein